MNEERTGLCLRQMEHIHGHLWHRYSVTANNHDGDRTSNELGINGSVASLLAVTCYQGNRDMKDKLWTCNPYARDVVTITMGKFCRKVSFTTGPRCQFLVVDSFISKWLA